MKRTISVLMLLLFLMSPFQTYGDKIPTVDIIIPESTLAEAIRTILPFHLFTETKTLEGDLIIDKIEDLALEDQQISGLVTIIGNDVQLITTLAGQSLRLKVGSLKVAFTIVARTRFEESTQTLYIRPSVTDISTKDDGSGSDLGNLIAELFNDREFPLPLDNLQPLVTDTGSKKLIVSMHIAALSISQDSLALHLLPAFESAE